LAPPIWDPIQDLRPYGETVVDVTFIPFLSEYLTGVDYTLSACCASAQNRLVVEPSPYSFEFRSLAADFPIPAVPSTRLVVSLDAERSSGANEVCKRRHRANSVRKFANLFTGELQLTVVPISAFAKGW